MGIYTAVLQLPITVVEPCGQASRSNISIFWSGALKHGQFSNGNLGSSQANKNPFQIGNY